jgi:hypothetical protein
VGIVDADIEVFSVHGNDDKLRLKKILGLF